MASTIPVIQVLSKQNFKEQHLVSLPNAYPLPTLAKSSIRVQPSIISLTNNVLTYASLAHLFGWWEFHPLPPSIPAQYSDANTFGRINTWGYGIVVESTSNIKVGTEIFGYLPIGTLPVDMAVDYNPELPGRFQEVSEHRSKLMAIYNRYFFAPRAATSDDREGQGYDALLRVLFETGWMMNRFVFAWDPAELVHPSGAAEGWSFEDAQLTGATVLLFAPSSKTGITFAHQLKHGRPEDKKPARVIAVGSASSKAFTDGTGLFDAVVDYGAGEQENLSELLGLNADSKVVVLEFGSRGAAAYRWIPKLQPLTKTVLAIGIGLEPTAIGPEKTTENITAGAQIIPNFLNAGAIRAGGCSILGDEAYIDAFLDDWNRCKAKGVVDGLGLVWGKGMQDVEKGWERLCKGEVGPTEGLVFEMPVGVGEKL